MYSIPNHKNPNKPYRKGVTFAELEKSFAALAAHGSFTRGWFNEHLPHCAAEGGCNFTTIGGLMELAGLARYAGKGVYARVETARSRRPAAKVLPIR